MTDAPTTLRDYRDTVFLPQTDFAMKAGLPEQEPKWIAKWAGQYARLKQDRTGAPRFVLHDGPPYANGNIHIGHAMNKILKDFVVRANLMAGKSVDYIPGWDCHGLPIEWKVEEQFRAEGKTKGEIDKATFRTACRTYADGWLTTQRAQFERLGIMGDFDNRYATMDFTTEAAIVAEFHKFVTNGLVYRALKPVMWSPVEQTALAEAEVEYKDKTSTAVWVKFKVIAEAGTSDPGSYRKIGELYGASIVIWTTTPWTLPGNRAISYNPDITYGLYEVVCMEDTGFVPWARSGDRLILADKLADSIKTAGKIAEWIRKCDIADPGAIQCEHPFKSSDREHPDAFYPVFIPLIPGSHVTDDAGTGFVHTAPGHGEDDYKVWRNYCADGRTDFIVPDTVGPDGAYLRHVPLFAGLQVLQTEGKDIGKDGLANKAVIDKLIEVGALLARAPYKHSYPHSWRSHAPVIFRATPQWFIAMDKPANGKTLRDTALSAIAATEWHPAQAQNRIEAMVKGRPDWLVSRQRAWGTPLAIFMHKTTGAPLNDPAVLARTQAAIAAHGADAWFTTPAAEFLGPDHNAADYEKIDDILDVWFDSGCTHAFTLKGADADYPVADLYLEGSDQHRGWFQSSLLESCGTRGLAPYKAVLTHGFVLDEQGRKMSKSLGNVVDPLKIADTSGAEILRLWVAMSDYGDDLRCGPEILKGATDAYRKLRNTLRYLLGALNGYSDSEAVAYAEMPSLEQYILNRVAEVDAKVRAGYADYDFRAVFEAVFTFTTNDLSAFYFDIRKDSLYCDAPSDIKRRSARTVMAELLSRLCQWLAPILVFTTEEAWTQRNSGSVHETPWMPVTPNWQQQELRNKWDAIRRARSVVTSMLEGMRTIKTIGSSLEAHPTIYLTDKSDGSVWAAYDDFKGVDAAEVCITSQADIKPWQEHALPEGATIMNGVAVVFAKAQGHKCVRSWKILPESDMVQDADGQWLTKRDAEAVKAWESARA
jgi:isoleucyl-tRNA synthetase